ncbi:hypothetical protein G4O51_12020 [Candidatus Bathyarchaeota archaeon A05DMB-2]|jgi:hypothetical protein|nr:hypothetical protein [Candidatus Bathyarchaeota archaeon A05DMB-2]
MKVYVEIDGDPRKGKCYARVVESVDTTKTNGYAFQGKFLREGETELPEGTIVLFVEEVGSWKHHYSEATIKQVTREGLTKIATYNYHKEFISLRDKIAELLNQKPNPLAAFTDEQIINEAKRRGLIP